MEYNTIRICSKCKKTVPLLNFSLKSDGSYKKLCKNCTNYTRKHNRRQKLLNEQEVRKRPYRARKTIYDNTIQNSIQNSMQEKEIAICRICDKSYIKGDTYDTIATICSYCNITAKMSNNDPLLLLKLSMYLAEKKIKE